MKFRLSTLPPVSLGKPRRRGMALLVVLAILVLLTALAFAVFLVSASERQSSSLFAGSVETRFLADTSVNLCMAQIGDATSQTNRAWISQPGLIRTFTGNRQADTNYRLYSWADMRVSGAFDPFSPANQIPSGWKSQKALYVDLNEPAPDPASPADASRDRYPILYPLSVTGGVAGYSVTNNSVGASTTAVPMPVQWLYVLKDGTVQAAAAGSGTNSTVTVSGATTANPIVGRIAFWADDESTKVNVNTAAGGRLWTEPRIETAAERSGYSGTNTRFGFSQPVKNEYQRYPGHPARTDLRAVFPELTRDDIYQLAPRVTRGGSQDGAVSTVVSGAGAIVPDADRLYSSPGELRFANTKASAAADRAFQTANFTSLTGAAQWTDLLEKRKAFLTASSRSPELTLFGTPRVAIWPVHETDSPAKRTALDQLIAFCSTINSGASAYPFYFTRANNLSATADISLTRNGQLYSYLQRLTDAPFPGASGEAFSSKYGGARGRDQILTEIFDYIRSTNLQDMQLSAANYYASQAIVMPTRKDMGNGDTTGFGRSLTVRQAGFLFICNADAAEPASNYAPGDPAATGANKANLSLAAYPGGTLQPGQRRVQALFLIELFSPSAGFKSWTMFPTVQVKGLDSAKLNGTSMQFPADATCPVPGVRLYSMTGGFGADGGAVNYRWLFQQGSGVGSQHKARDVATTGGLVSTGTTSSYPLIGIPVTVNAAGNMTLEGGPVTIEIYANSAKTELLGKAEFNIGTVPLTVPTLPSDQNYWAFHKNGIFGNADPANPVGRFGPIDGTSNSLASITGKLVDPADTVQTWILPHGDLRMLFGPKTGGLAQFDPSPSAGSLPNMKHFLLDLSPFVVGSGTSATLMQSVKMSTRLVPAMMPPDSYPPGLNAPWTFGDWDSTTPFFIEDGPFINKPDEGSLYDANTTINPYSTQQGNTEVSGLGSQYHSANRQISSAVMFGSLPTGMIEGQPWQTLLFRPDPGGHPGAADPPDHLLLDLFWMPVVEPYAISEPFSTAGKANMNYQMIPFTWIERSTGLHAVLANEALLALPDSTILPGSNGGFTKLRGAAAVDFNPALPLDAQETLTPFRTKFANGGVFITPSEITTLPLVPQGQTYAGMSAFWNTNRPTGENLRERPYATIYPRLTTKSNVFNIHYRVQTLRQPPGGEADVWDESKGRTTAELRGSTLVERYIDMNAAGLLGDFATDASANAESLYRFRILATKDFNP